MRKWTCLAVALLLGLCLVLGACDIRMPWAPPDEPDTEAYSFNTMPAEPDTEYYDATDWWWY